MTNPLLAAWETPFGVPPFEGLEPDHFRPAFDHAMSQQRREVEAVMSDSAPAGFANTIEALELSGRSLRQVAAVFFSLAGAHTSEALQEIEREIAPVLARHRTWIYQNEALFGRINRLWDRRDMLGLTPEQSRVLERYRILFIRNGAALDPDSRRRLGEITERLAALGTRFSQNVLADETSFRLVLESEGDLAGLPDFVRQAGARAAADHDLPGRHVITLSRSSIEPFLQFSRRRDLREAVWRAWVSRGERDGPTDNRAIAAEMVALRAERARLLGYASFAHFRLDDTMAKSPEAALDLLMTVWRPARAQALRETAALQSIVQAEGGNFEVSPWDWRYYSEKRRVAEFDISESEVKPYLQLDNIIEAAFHTANRLFGLTFTERFDVPVYHPDVRVWEVGGRDGRHVGVFLGDYFGRPSKRSGAWMTHLRTQEKLAGDIRPVVVNVMNFSKAAEGEPALLSMEDARTLFHEFGHALHGLLSDVTYPMIAGTNVARDFVELPSQLYEHWLEQEPVLQRFAVHHRTAEPMPGDLLQRLLATQTFNQGFATVEYVASAVADLRLHLIEAPQDIDLSAFEAETLAELEMPPAITMRHRLPHFAHLFAGEAYSAGYYSYLWSEVLDADAFEAFEEAGDVFDPATAERLATFIYSAGFLREPDEAYLKFRGRAAEPAPLLRQRGLVEMRPEAEV
jgi:peptidyl-dipeptidase Dcp